MALVKSKNTRPEMLVRRLVHRAGFRYTLHGKDLPGRPDIVFSKRRKVIFINGCFWHGHEQCKLARVPKSNVSFWTEKIQRNRERDSRVQEALHVLGWSVLVIWECEMHNEDALLERVRIFLNATTASV